MEKCAERIFGNTEPISMTIVYLFPIVLVAIVMVLFWIVVKRKHFRGKVAMSSAIVTDFEDTGETNGGTKKKINIEYRIDYEGRGYDAKGVVWTSNPEKFEKGQTIQVMFNKDNPNASHIETNPNEVVYSMLAILIFFGAIITLGYFFVAPKFCIGF
jgi:hypothetical protein